MRILLALIFSCVFFAGLKLADAQEAKEIKKLILPGESFLVENRPAFILWPDESLRKSPQPWVFYAPTLAAYPDEAEKWMHQQFLAAGIAVAGIDVGEAYGSPASRKLFDQFFEQQAEQLNPIARMEAIAKARLPVFIVHGDDDKVVPLKENSGTVLEAYQKAPIASFRPQRWPLTPLRVGFSSPETGRGR